MFPLIRNATAAVALSLLAGAMLAASVPTPAGAQSMASRYNFNSLNAYRKANGAPSIKVDAALQSAAQQYARYLAIRDKAGHTADGRTPEQRMRAAGFRGCWFAENVYGHWSTEPLHNVRVRADARKGFMAHDWWKNSPGHAANMRNPKYTLIGIGFASITKGNRHIFKAVQNFGAPC